MKMFTKVEKKKHQNNICSQKMSIIQLLSKQNFRTTRHNVQIMVSPASPLHKNNNRRKCLEGK